VGAGDEQNQREEKKRAFFARRPPAFSIVPTDRDLAKVGLLTLIRWIAIYLVDSVIHPLNNFDQFHKLLEVKLKFPK